MNIDSLGPAAATHQITPNSLPNPLIKRYLSYIV